MSGIINKKSMRYTAACLMMSAVFASPAHATESYVEKMSRLDMEMELNKKMQAVQKQRLDIERNKFAMGNLNKPATTDSAQREQRRLQSLANSARIRAVLDTVKVLRTYKLPNKQWEALVSIEGGELPLRTGDEISGVGTIKEVFLGGIDIKIDKSGADPEHVKIAVMKREKPVVAGAAKPASPQTPANAPRLVF